MYFTHIQLTLNKRNRNHYLVALRLIFLCNLFAIYMVNNVYFGKTVSLKCNIITQYHRSKYAVCIDLINTDVGDIFLKR